MAPSRPAMGAAGLCSLMKAVLSVEEAAGLSDRASVQQVLQPQSAAHDGPHGHDEQDEDADVDQDQQRAGDDGADGGEKGALLKDEMAAQNRIDRRGT